MKKLVALFILISGLGPFLQAKEQDHKIALNKYPEFKFKRSFSFNEEACKNTEGPFLHSSDYDFNEFKDETKITYYASREVLKRRYEKLINGPKRLRRRMSYDGKNFYIPSTEGSIKITKDFLNKLAHQVEMAIEIKSAELIYYPDMGHAHLYMPEGNELMSLEEALSSPDLVTLFHTAEQLMMKDGRMPRDSKDYRQLRYRTRNLIGHFDDTGALEMVYAFGNKAFNTIHDIPTVLKHKRKYSTLYFSAHPHGCLTFNLGDKKMGLDISFSR